jgi:hypothetical protein
MAGAAQLLGTLDSSTDVFDRNIHGTEIARDSHQVTSEEHRVAGVAMSDPTFRTSKICKHLHNRSVPARSDQPTPTDETLRDELARTRHANARLRDELARVERGRAQTERLHGRLRRENERLKDELEAALRRPYFSVTCR